MSAPPACPICTHREGNTTFSASEKMFGLGGSFTYLECAGCGCLHLLDPPPDLSPYYPTAYYSYRSERPGTPTLREWLTHWMSHHLAAHRMGTFDPIGRIIAGTGKLAWLPRLPKGFRSRVLDVGCGSGALLLLLQRIGFHDLTGVDPFIAADIHYPNGVRIFQRELAAIDGPFDLIHLGHTFEHMADPLAMMRCIRERLAPDGVAVIRIPVADSFAWRHYRDRWVQLDAPRHFFLHTSKSMALLAEAAGLHVDRELRDSTAFQFSGSEKYLRGLPLNAPDPFTAAERKAFTGRARALNRKGEGDTATFHLRLA